MELCCAFGADEISFAAHIMRVISGDEAREVPVAVKHVPPNLASVSSLP